MSDGPPSGRYASAVALTPRVRAFVVCDEAFASDIEAEVHTLENAGAASRRDRTRTSDRCACICMGPCVFSDPGWYTCQVVFQGPGGRTAIKGEQPFLAIQEE